MQKKVLIHSSQTIPEEKYDLIFNWDGSTDNGSEISIPERIESDSDHYKEEFLKWIYSLENLNFKNRTLSSYLKIRSDFSLWQTSLLFEKSKWKSPGLYSVFQLLALNDLLNTIDAIGQIDINIPDQQSTKCIKDWCRENKIQYINLSINSEKSITFSGFVKKMPYIFQALAWLIRYFLRIKKIKFFIRKDSSIPNNDLSIISYFFNVNSEKFDNGIFYTSYWTELHNILSNSKKKTNWFHIFQRSNKFKNLEEATLKIKNINTEESQKHYLIDNFLSYRIFFKIIIDYFRVYGKSHSFFSFTKKYFSINSKGINFFKVLEHDWKCSIFGKTAIAGCLYLNIFEEIFSRSANQKIGLYLMENQAWERCLVYAWKKNFSGKIIGVPHTLITFWDLRHFFTKKHLRSKHNYEPDGIAVNGNFSRNMMLGSGFQESQLFSVEALRFQYLLDIKKTLKPKQNKLSRILILGDCDFEVTMKLLNMVSCLPKKLLSDLKIILKPHPLALITKNDFHKFTFEISTLSIGELIDSYDIAFTSNPTVASVDVFLSNKKTLIMQDYSSFNMSPLRGVDGVSFISSPSDLEEEITKNFETPKRKISDFFELNKELKNWKKLLDIEV